MDEMEGGGLHWCEFTVADVQSASSALEHPCTAVVSLCASPSQSQEVDTAFPLHKPTELLLLLQHAISIDIAPCADVCHALEKPTLGNGEPQSAVLAPLLFIMPVKKEQFRGCDPAAPGVLGYRYMHWDPRATQVEEKLNN